jgi:glycerophosphoryl diester phosphodiesterase
LLRRSGMLNRTYFIGHRGARGLADENTMESLKKGISLGVDMVELDFHPTRDGRFVLMHDETIDRTTDGRGKVSDFSFSQLRKIRTRAGFAVPSLEEALRLVKAKRKLVFVDAKRNVGFEKQLVRLLKGLGLIERTIVDNERPSNCVRLKALCPELRVAVSPPVVGAFLLDPVSYLKKYKADYVDINYRFVTKKLVERLHSNGFGITVWVINDKKNIAQFTRLGVDGIMSDFPDLFPTAV